MIQRQNAKALVKGFLDRSTIEPLEKSLLKLGLTKVPDDSPLLTVTADVLTALEHGNTEEARHILYRTADMLIDTFQAQAQLTNGTEGNQGK